jgi:Tim44-like domain
MAHNKSDFRTHSREQVRSRIGGVVLEFLKLFVGMLFRIQTRPTGYFSETDLMPDTSSLGPDIVAQPMWQKARQQIDDLRKIDPDFNEVAFLSIAASAYTTALAAEGAMDSSGARDVVTPAFAARLAQRIDKWNNQGLRRVVNGIKLDGTTLFKVSLDGATQSLVVRVSGSSVRYLQDAATGVATEGSKQIESFTEFATLVRPASAVTPKTAQVGGPTHCPSCGAPAPTMATKCQFCNTPLTPGGAPWLLDHVSQSAYT